jgi:hypothetical protein
MGTKARSFCTVLGIIITQISNGGQAVLRMHQAVVFASTGNFCIFIYLKKMDGVEIAVFPS